MLSPETFLSVYFLIGFTFASICAMFHGKLWRVLYFFEFKRFGKFELICWSMAWPFIIIEIIIGIICLAVYTVCNQISIDWIFTSMDNYLEWLKRVGR